MTAMMTRTTMVAFGLGGWEGGGSVGRPDVMGANEGVQRVWDKGWHGTVYMDVCVCTRL
jgi:hypothetical protein